MAGGFDAKVDGLDQLDALKRDYKAAGTRELKQELTAAGRRLDRPVSVAVRRRAESDLPSRNGLNKFVSKRLQFHTTTQITGSGVRFRFTTTGKADVRALNSGAFRHPLYGNRAFWYRQSIKGGFVDRALDDMSETIRAEFLQAVDAALRKLR